MKIYHTRLMQNAERDRSGEIVAEQKGKLKGLSLTKSALKYCHVSCLLLILNLDIWWWRMPILIVLALRDKYHNNDLGYIYHIALICVLNETNNYILIYVYSLNLILASRLKFVIVPSLFKWRQFWISYSEWHDA